VRDLKSIFVHDAKIIEQNVNVERSWLHRGTRAAPSTALLDLQGSVEQGSRLGRLMDLGGTVQEPGQRLVTDRLGQVKRGNGTDLESGAAQPVEAAMEPRATVSDIRAEA
jgi:hypothetical protein